MNVFLNGELLRGRPEVLTDGDALHARVPQIVKHVQNFVPGLAQAQHERAFGLQARSGRSPPQQIERIPINRARTHRPVKARDGLDIVAPDEGSLG